MDSGLTEDDRRRIEAFCDTPPADRSPELLTPDGDDDSGDDAERDDSRLRALLGRLRR